MSPEQALTYAMDNVTMDEDDLSDEYDFMDEDPEARRREKAKQRQQSLHKYLDILQRLADRKLDQVVIDLDDLAAVSQSNPVKRTSTIANRLSVRRAEERGPQACPVGRGKH